MPAQADSVWYPRNRRAFLDRDDQLGGEEALNGEGCETKQDKRPTSIVCRPIELNTMMITLLTTLP